MTEDTQRANALQDVYFFQPELALPIKEACAWWRAAGYEVDNYSATMDSKTQSVCRIYPSALKQYGKPHSADPGVVCISGWDDATAVVLEALRLAAAKWPGVV